MGIGDYGAGGEEDLYRKAKVWRRGHDDLYQNAFFLEEGWMMIPPLLCPPLCIMAQSRLRCNDNGITDLDWSQFCNGSLKSSLNHQLARASLRCIITIHDDDDDEIMTHHDES